MPAKTALALIASVMCLTTAGCGITEKIRPYKLDIRQGNFVTQEMISKLKKGMTRDQVRFALGTPMLTDVFHADRWDYVYRFEPGYGETEQRVVTVHFENDLLASVSGDVTAAEPGGDASAQGQRRIRELDLSAPAPEATGDDANKESEQ